MTDSTTADTLRQLLLSRVGGFFHNARHEAGVTCTVCAAPTEGTRCWRCRPDHAEFRNPAR